MRLWHLVCSATTSGLLAVHLAAQEPVPILLWPDGAPGSEGQTAAEVVRLTDRGEHIVSRVHHPSITPYLPAAASSTGAAVIVIPGGGHRELWMDHEGYRVGRWLSEHGIAAFVLKYRLAREEGSRYTVEGDALADVQRAIRLVRSRASGWHIAGDRIGVMGFSAGGELAALAGTRFDEGAPGSADPVAREGSRPAFMGLIYAAIPGSLDLRATTPPAFLLFGDSDIPLISDSLPNLYRAIRRAGGSAELHVLAGAGHGFGLRDDNPPPVADWMSLFYTWLDARHLVGSPSAATGVSSQMRDGIPGAGPVAVYTAAERAAAAQEALGLAAPPTLGTPVSLTPDAPYARGGAHLSFWKPSFVMGTAGGGEAGVNFWGIHTEGHVNVGFASKGATEYLLDCRLLSAGKITYKIYSGAGESLQKRGAVALNHNHFLLLVPTPTPDEPVSVELWPTPVTEPMGLLGCDLSAVGAMAAPQGRP
jgi:endo-1,4-beta-xylanase